jgi:RNA polymerase III subunit RPC34
MMAHLEPSVELTGGPWYTDNELDTEFIKLLCSACLRYIRERVCDHLFHFPSGLIRPQSDTAKTQA